METVSGTAAHPWASGRGPLQRLVLEQLGVRGEMNRQDLIDIARADGYSSAATRRTLRTLADRGLVDMWTGLGKWGVWVGPAGTRPAYSVMYAGAGR